MPDTATYIQLLSSSDHLRKPAIRAAIEALRLPKGSRGLDAGCGIGRHTLWLAEAVTPGGQVAGLDVSPEFLRCARETAKKSVFSEQVSFREGDMNNLPFDNDTFDWVWSTDCLWPKPAVTQPVETHLRRLKELVRVVKPGGTIALLFWSSQRLLPGYPLLEAHLDATPAGTAPFSAGTPPELHVLRALGWLRSAGLRNPTARTFVADIHAPLNDDVRQALTELFEMRWGKWSEMGQSGMAQADWAEFQRLCQPDSPDFILDLPDYYAFFTYSLFRGTVVQ